MKRKMYMEVTMDKYSLPVAYADTPRELSRICDVPSRFIERAEFRKPSKHMFPRFVCVVFDDDDDNDDERS